MGTQTDAYRRRGTERAQMTTRVARPSVTITEAQLQDTIVSAARKLGYLTYHTIDARLNEPGFPDLIIVGFGQIVVWEVKTARGKLRPASKPESSARTTSMRRWSC